MAWNEPGGNNNDPWKNKGGRDQGPPDLDDVSLVGDITATTLSLDLGNRYQALPFTVIAEPDGKIVLRHMGEITREQLEPKIKAAIENNRRTLDMPKRI